MPTGQKRHNYGKEARKVVPEYSIYCQLHSPKYEFIAGEEKIMTALYRTPSSIQIVVCRECYDRRLKKKLFLTA